MGRSKIDEITPLKRETLDKICRHIDAIQNAIAGSEIDVVIG